MTRRELMLLLLGSALTASRGLRAEQKAMPVIGYLNATSPGPYAPNLAAFLEGRAKPAGSKARTW
jgi:putative ABC transport system substrate-binding protein